MFQLNYDPDIGVIHTRASGFWSEDEALQYQQELMPLIQRSRRKNGHMRHIFETQLDMSVMPKAAVATMEDFARDLTPEDKLAIVLSPGLLRMQMSRVVPLGDQKAYFSSVDEAREWIVR